MDLLVLGLLAGAALGIVAAIRPLAARVDSRWEPPAWEPAPTRAPGIIPLENTSDSDYRGLA